MEKLLNELKELIENNEKIGISYDIQYSSYFNEWDLNIGSAYSDEEYIFSESDKSLTDLLESGIKKVKNFIDNFEWEDE